MDAKITAALIGLSGLFIGSFLNGIGFFLKERYQRLKIINQSIFYLLKLLHVVSVLNNLDRYSSFYSKILKNHPKVKGLMNVDENTLNTYCNNILVSSVNPVVGEVNEKFKLNFDESLLELANIKPVTAFELGKISYSEALSQKAKEIQKNPNYMETENPGFNEGFQIGAKASQQNILRDLEKALIKIIKSLSWNASFSTMLSSRYEIIKLKRTLSEKKMESGIANYIDKVVIPILEPYLNQTSR